MITSIACFTAVSLLFVELPKMELPKMIFTVFEESLIEEDMFIPNNSEIPCHPFIIFFYIIL